MSNSMKHKTVLLISVSLLMIIACEETELMKTSITGTVYSETEGGTIYPAYIILNKELLVTTDVEGNFEITSLEAGSYSLTCSAINYGDQIIQVELEEGKIASYDFILKQERCS